MQPNPGASIVFLAFVAMSVAAIATAKGPKWRLINLGIILAFCLAGIGIGFIAAAWGQNSELGGHIASSLMILLGFVGALGCYRRNKRREKLENLAPTKT